MEKHFIEQHQKNSRRSNIVISSLVFLVLILAVVRVVIANVSVDASEKLKNLDKEITVLREENQLRGEKIRTRESLIKIEQQATGQGFEKTPKYAFVEGDKEVASARNEFLN